MIFVTGDMHGDESRITKKRLDMLKKGDTLIVCGDFGFLWDDSVKERSIRKKLERRDYNICFVDGPHENFRLLNSFPVVEWNGGLAHKIQNNVYHLMRGQMYTINGRKVFTMGGGESADVDVLDADMSENDRAAIPTDKELLAAVNRMEQADFTCDYIITHEPPSKVKEFLLLGDSAPLKVTALSAFFDELQAQCNYKCWYFGSMHMDKYISASQRAVFKVIINTETDERL